MRTDLFLSLVRLSLEAPLLSRDVLGAMGSPESLVYRTATKKIGHPGLSNIHHLRSISFVQQQQYKWPYCMHRMGTDGSKFALRLPEAER